MRELEYPFDAGWILSNRRKIKKRLLSSDANFIEKKIAVLGGSSTANIVWILELFLLQQGIRPVFYESEFDKYYEDAVFSNEMLKQFKPDIIYIHTSNRNVTAYPKMADSKEAIDVLLDAEMQRFETIWNCLAEKYACPIIQNNFEMPHYRLLGNKDASDIHGAGHFLMRLNAGFYAYAQSHENFFICDINYISADYGLKEWADPFYWHMYKYALNVNAIPYLAFNVSNIIKSIFGKNRKGFVLDLDNTLWGGVIGDDGAENIKLGLEEPEGSVYFEFQKYIKAHKQLGILLAVASKNEEENALAGLNHPDSALKPDDMVCIRANWDTKDKNFKDIAKELNVLPESLVFVDDNPAERHIVREQLPGVVAPEIGEAHQYIQVLDRSGFFEVTYFSQDDLKRSEMYRENAGRLKLQAGFTDYGDYLKSLEMRAVIRPFESVYMARIAQLTNKSNQFNLTTKRYTQSEIERAAENESFITLYGKLADRFGDNGVVAVCIGKIEGTVCHIVLWLMSCRVLKRDMEYAMMDVFVRRCRDRGMDEIRGYYYPTSKNGMVKEFYGAMGFAQIADEHGDTVWSLSVNSYIDKNKYIKAEENDETRGSV